MKYKTKISTWCPVFSGLYENWMWEPDFESEAEYFRDEHGFIGELWKNHNWTDWKNQVGKAFCSYLEDFLKDFVTKIQFEEIRSPREYNFDTDAINCVITVKPKAIREYIYAHKDAFDEYLHDRYTSRSGFMSWHPNNFEDWEINTSSFKDLSHKHYCGAILQFICITEGIEESDIYEQCQDHSCLNVEYEKALYDQIDRVHNFAKDNYMNPNRLSLMHGEFNAEEFDLEAIIRKVDAEIEAHVLTIPFNEKKQKKA